MYSSDFKHKIEVTRSRYIHVLHLMVQDAGVQNDFTIPSNMDLNRPRGYKLFKTELSMKF